MNQYDPYPRQLNTLAQNVVIRNNPFKTFLTAFFVTWGGVVGAGWFVLLRNRSEMNLILGVLLSGAAGAIAGLIAAAFTFRIPALIGNLAEWTKDASAGVIKAVASWVFTIVGLWLLFRFRHEVVELLRSIVNALSEIIREALRG